jgi:hypothetical protein
MDIELRISSYEFSSRTFEIRFAYIEGSKDSFPDRTNRCFRKSINERATVFRVFEQTIEMSTPIAMVYE